MHLKKIGMYQTTPGGICLRGEEVSLKMEFVAENIFRMWTTLQEDFRQEETLVVGRTAFDCPNVCVAEQDNLVMISTPKITACIHLEPFYVEAVDIASVTPPVGWICVSQKQEILATGQTVSKFLLQMEGREFTSTGTVTLKLRRGEKLLSETVNLLSGWVTWWKLAGAYR